MKNISYISAGAGSGKTTRIVDELVKAVREKGIAPSSVIMTTFTKAAAQEMRERARTGLLKANMGDKASELDAAAIGTIHSVCLQFLKRFWYLLSISPDPKQLEDVDFRIFTDRSINKIVTEDEVRQLEEWRAELGISKGIYNEDYVDYWRDMLRKMVEKVRYYPIDLQDSKDRSRQEINELFAANQFSQDRYDQLTEAYKDALPRKKNGDYTAIALNRLDLLKDFDPEKPDKDTLKSLSGNLKSFAEAGFDIEEWKAEVLKSEFSEEKQNTLLAITDTVFAILERWKEEYQRFKDEFHLLDYNDMELRFVELLGKEEVQEDIRKRYKLILVDEFQDCNPVQVEIFSKLSELVEQSIWVGDPKQAIYGFRGSDTALVKSLSDTIRANEEAGVAGFDTDSLPNSHRSRPMLVDFANNIFVPLFQQPEFGLLEKEIKLGHGRRSGDDDPFDESEPTTAFLNLKGKKEETLSSLAEQCAKLGETHPWGKIAILVRKNDTVKNVVEALRARGIPVSSPEVDIFPRVEVQLLLALLQYALSKKYRMHLRADILHILRNESTDSLLNSYIESRQEDWRLEDEAVQIAEEVAKDANGRAIHDILATFVDRLALYDRVAQWGEADTRRNNINTILRVAAQYDTHCEQLEKQVGQARFSDFSQYMIDSDITPTHNLDSNAIKVMTIHKSKGLQWSVVVLYDLDNTTLEDTSIVKFEFCSIREQSKKDGYWLRVFPSLGSSMKNMVGHIKKTEYFEKSTARLHQEECRLFYVAATRARDMLIFAASGTKWLDALELPNFSPDWSDVEPTLATNRTASEKYALIDAEKTHREALKDEKGKVLKAHINPSTASVPAEHFTTSEQKLNTPAFQTYQGEATDEEQTVRQSTIGTCVHNIYASFNENDDEAQAVDKATEILKAFGLNDMLDANAIIAAIRALYVHLKATYGEAVKVRHEVPFTQRLVNGQVLRGEIDLLWYTSDNECVLVDFKNIQSDTPNPDHYRGQMAAYRSALQAANIECNAIVLYYASMGTVVTMYKAQ